MNGGVTEEREPQGYVVQRGVIHSVPVNLDYVRSHLL